MLIASRSAKDGVLGDYRGGRTLQALKDFAHKLVRSVLRPTVPRRPAALTESKSGCALFRDPSPVLQTLTPAIVELMRQNAPVAFIFFDESDSRRTVRGGQGHKHGRGAQARGRVGNKHVRREQARKRAGGNKPEDGR